LWIMSGMKNSVSGDACDQETFVVRYWP
jgi:hypothetical protein